MGCKRDVAVHTDVPPICGRMPPFAPYGLVISMWESFGVPPALKVEPVEDHTIEG